MVVYSIAISVWFPYGSFGFYVNECRDKYLLTHRALDCIEEHSSKASPRHQLYFYDMEMKYNAMVYSAARCCYLYLNMAS